MDNYNWPPKFWVESTGALPGFVNGALLYILSYIYQIPHYISRVIHVLNLKYCDAYIHSHAWLQCLLVSDITVETWILSIRFRCLVAYTLQLHSIVWPMHTDFSCLNSSYIILLSNSKKSHAQTESSAFFQFNVGLELQFSY